MPEISQMLIRCVYGLLFDQSLRIRVSEFSNTEPVPDLFWDQRFELSGESLNVHALRS